MYPKVNNPDKVGTYPAYSFSGGGYFYDEVLEYRVWVHPANGNDDFYCFFANYEAALEYSQKTDGAEEPLVLVLQKEHINEPEKGVFIKIKKKRITEWCVEWLVGSKREKNSIDNFILEQDKK